MSEPAIANASEDVCCECCERAKRTEHGWIVGLEGEDLCPQCVGILQHALERQIAALPKRIGLCPDCAPEFYYPLSDGESLLCPTPCCGHTMIVYEQSAL